MKRDTISFFRLSLVIIGYLIYNILFYSYPSGEYSSFAWPFLVSKGTLPDGIYLFDAYVLVPEKDTIKNDQQYLAVKVEEGKLNVYWQNR